MATLDDYAQTVVEAVAGIAGPVVVAGHGSPRTFGLITTRPGVSI